MWVAAKPSNWVRNAERVLGLPLNVGGACFASAVGIDDSYLEVRALVASPTFVLAVVPSEEIVVGIDCTVGRLEASDAGDSPWIPDMMC